MKRLLKRLIITTPVLVSLAVGAQAQPPAHGSGMLTRNANKYKDLETKLFEALQDDDRSTAEQILAQDYEAWAAEKLAPTARAEWMQAFLGNLKTFRIRNIAVRQFKDVSVVSFLLDRSGTANGKPMSPVLFIVDVWRNQGDQLLVRYASAPSSPAPEDTSHKE